MMLQTRKKQILLAAFIFLLSGQVAAADCQYAWLHPSSQTMRMDSAYSSTLTEYNNMERHYSVKQTDHTLDIYYLQGLVLVKGFSDDQIEKMAQSAGLFMLPMNIALPAAILIEAAPKGPCNIASKTPFSIKLSDGSMLQDRKMTSAKGQISRDTRYDVSYEMDVLTDPPSPNKGAVRIVGTMSFAPKQAAPSDDTDIRGYTVVRRSKTCGVAGSKGVPSKLGELRRFLSSGNIK